MNIVEAIKSGKRFRRKSWTGRDYIEANVSSLDLRTDALVADDWEVEEKQVTITESHFQSAISRANQSFSMYNPPHICEYLEQLKKELGL